MSESMVPVLLSSGSHNIIEEPQVGCFTYWRSSRTPQIILCRLVLSLDMLPCNVHWALRRSSIVADQRECVPALLIHWKAVTVALGDNCESVLSRYYSIDRLFTGLASSTPQYPSVP